MQVLLLKSVVAAALLLVANNPASSQPLATSGAATAQEPEPENAPEPYSFSYSSEAVGGMSAHQESGDGRGHVQGFYMLMGDDGRERRVDYVADENGYRASVSTNEVGTRSESTGDAQYSARLPSQGQLEQAKVTADEYQQLEDLHAAARARTAGGRGQQQQKSYNNLTSASVATVDDWRARSAQRQTTGLNFSPPAGSTFASATNLEQTAQPPQQQQQSWRGALPVARTPASSSNIQSQLKQQFMQQAYQLTDQDYPRGSTGSYQQQQQQNFRAQQQDLSQFNQQQNNVIDEIIGEQVDVNQNNTQQFIQEAYNKARQPQQQQQQFVQQLVQQPQFVQQQPQFVQQQQQQPQFVQQQQQQPQFVQQQQYTPTTTSTPTTPPPTLASSRAPQGFLAINLQSNSQFAQEVQDQTPEVERPAQQEPQFQQQQFETQKVNENSGQVQVQPQVQVVANDYQQASKGERPNSIKQIIESNQTEDLRPVSVVVPETPTTSAAPFVRPVVETTTQEIVTTTTTTTTTTTPAPTTQTREPEVYSTSVAPLIKQTVEQQQQQSYEPERQTVAPIRVTSGYQQPSYTTSTRPTYDSYTTNAGGRFQQQQQQTSGVKGASYGRGYGNRTESVQQVEQSYPQRPNDSFLKTRPSQAYNTTAAQYNQTVGPAYVTSVEQQAYNQQQNMFEQQQQREAEFARRQQEELSRQRQLANQQPRPQVQVSTSGDYQQPKQFAQVAANYSTRVPNFNGQQQQFVKQQLPVAGVKGGKTSSARRVQKFWQQPQQPQQPQQQEAPVLQKRQASVDYVTANNEGGAQASFGSRIGRRR